jgi:MerR family transcriptional regulator, thiopeptide resistance regulator
MSTSLTPEERHEVFGDFDPAAHEAEAEERWGSTTAYQQSASRTRGYTKDDWIRIKAEAQDTTRRLGEAFTSGVAASAPQAMDLAEDHRQHITRWFYDCPKEMHVKLGEMYIADPRFTATYDTVAPGLAQWFHEAIAANAARQ